jgi:20S proteasome alpha/beta subunit
MDEHNIEVGVIRSDKIFKVLTPHEVKEYLDELQ